MNDFFRKFRCSIMVSVFAILGCIVPSCYGQDVACSASEGNNGVYATCTGSTKVAGSTAIIDASAFSQSDLCTAINKILLSTVYTYPAAGAVIDARGVPAVSNYLNCQTNP